MNMKKQIFFEQHIRALLLDSNNCIYRSNLVLLEKYYNYIWDNLKSPNVAKKYLELFNTIECIKTVTIEGFFHDIICSDYDRTSLFSLDFIEELYKLDNIGGIYFIYNNIGNIIYIGKSQNLYNRLQQSFINKLPFNATSVKYLIDTRWGDKQYDLIEAIAIDYYKPMLNQKLESLPEDINYRTYTFITQKIMVELNKANKIYVTDKKEYSE